MDMFPATSSTVTGSPFCLGASSLFSTSHLRHHRSLTSSSSPSALKAAPSRFTSGVAYENFLGLSESQECSFRGYFLSSKPKRSVRTMVVPVEKRRTRKQRQKPPPPDLPSYLFSNRIVYMGMCLLPEVQELITAELLYLQHEDSKKPIYLYINSTGTMKNGENFGFESEALSIYDIMRYVKPPIYTLCVGNAWGEAALLLAAGAKGNRSALPSSSIMLRQPLGRTEGQAADVDIAKREITELKKEIVHILAKHIGKSPEQIEADIYRPKYFSPADAVEYGIIDKVLYNEKAPGDGGVSADQKEYPLM